VAGVGRVDFTAATVRPSYPNPSGAGSAGDDSGSIAFGFEIDEIEGIGPAFAEKLRAAGITDTDTLLTKGCTKKGRETIAAQSGIGEGSILKWVNMADLLRIQGVGGEFAELLEAAGVDTVKELGTRNAENLAARLAEVNEQKSTRPPGRSQSAVSRPSVHTPTGCGIDAGKVGRQGTAWVANPHARSVESGTERGSSPPAIGTRLASIQLQGASGVRRMASCRYETSVGPIPVPQRRARPCARRRSAWMPRG
jgi:predicted flap endonuclease-1-like 5' DNA nuclease